MLFTGFGTNCIIWSPQSAAALVPSKLSDETDKTVAGIFSLENLENLVSKCLSVYVGQHLSIFLSGVKQGHSMLTSHKDYFSTVDRFL